MTPASDLNCKIRPSEADFSEVTALLQEWDLNPQEDHVLCSNGARIYFCVSSQGIEGVGRYVSYQEGDRASLYGPFKGRGWKADMVDCILDLSERAPDENPDRLFVEAVLSVLEEIAEVSLPLADLFCETRFILPAEELEEMSVVHHTDDNGETSFGFLGVINAALKAMSSPYLIVSRWGGDDQSEFIGFSVLKDGDLVDL